jgi:hypothetical protein
VSKRRTVSRGAWGLLIVVFLSTSAVTGNMATGLVILLTCAAGVYAGGRVSRALDEEGRT